MTDEGRVEVLARRILVGDSKGVHHLAYKGATRIVGWTLCRISIKFNAAFVLEESKWTYMRILKHGTVNCIDCLAIGDTLVRGEAAVPP